MKTKIVYSLVSSEKDFYLEQLLLSLISLRHYNPSANVTVVMDKSTKCSLIGKRNHVLNYIDEIVVVDGLESLTNGQKSRYIKTTLRERISGAYLFIDVDTIITDTLDSIDELLSKVEIAAVKDSHCNFNEMKRQSVQIDRARTVGWDDIVNDKIHFNSGVMFVSDSELTRDFYKKWYDNWLFEKSKGLFYDQIALAHTNQQLGYPITELEGVWNCQIFQDGLPYLYDAKIIHYFGDNKKGRCYYFRNKDAFEHIKATGNVDTKTLYYTLNGKKAFVGHSIILGDEDQDFYWSPIYQVYIKSQPTFKLLCAVANLYLSTRKSIGKLIKFSKSKIKA